MYSVKLFCYVCKEPLEIGFEYKEGSKKEWLIKPCKTCSAKGLEFEKLYTETAMLLNSANHKLSQINQLAK